jgi:LacI family transcriptional regulator
MKKAPTLQDVANYAKVSTATVSNVINNTKPVRSGTKLRVLEAIEKLDYIPNDLAKSLKVQDTKLIGLLISDIANPFFPPVVRGIGDYLAANGYNILLSETSSL